MIPEADRSLARLLERQARLPKGTTVVVATPSATWAAGVKRPAVDLWLHDIREDLDHRTADWHDVRNPQGRITGRQAPLRRYRLRYAVTAWCASAEDEHAVLGQLLSCLTAAQVFPRDCLDGYLAEESRPVTLDVALPAAGTGMPWDAWSALGTEPRLALDVVMIVPLDEPPVEDVGPPVQSRTVSVAQQGGTPELLNTAPRDAIIRRLKSEDGTIRPHRDVPERARSG